jgi:ATP/maltotriose-dependent transcriptional regulator MalT
MSEDGGLAVFLPIATKLYVPRPRAQLIPRAHLTERLQQGVERALTLVSAPAGFGKTTLLAQWLVESGTHVAWLSLEAEDNDPTRFLSYLIAALQTLDAQLGTTALALLRTPQPPSPEAALAVLTNELVERGGGDVALVLDDYHVITADPIQRGMTFPCSQHEFDQQNDAQNDQSCSSFLSTSSGILSSSRNLSSLLYHPPGHEPDGHRPIA